MRRSVLAGAVAVLLGAGGAALGAFTASVGAVGALSTGVLQPPTGITTQHPNATGANAGQVNLGWTASTSTFTTGHRVRRATAPGGPWTTVATLGAAATSHSDATSAYNAQYFYLVQAFRDGWTADTAVRMAHSLPVSSGLDRVSGSGPGTALTGPYATAGTQLAALSAADGTRYTPPLWADLPGYYAGVAYLDATHAWVTGTTGAALSSNGSTWTNLVTGSGQNLEQVKFADASTGWAVGSGGAIVKTTNGGTTWAAQASGSLQTFWDIDCVSTTACWAVGSGGTIVATTNGGTTWVAQASGATGSLWDVDCVSATACWLVGDGGVVRVTTNGGSTWTAQNPGVTSRLMGLSCVSTTRCWASGDNGVIRLTGDGGVTWTAQTSGTTQSLWRIDMPTAAIGYVAGAGGQVRKTVDGGVTWTALAVPGSTYYGLACADASRCATVSAAGEILTTADGGTTWNEATSTYVELTPTLPVVGTSAVTSVVVRLVHRTTTIPGAGSRFALQASADGGATWTTFPLTAPPAANTDVTQTVDITSLGFSPNTRVQTLRLRYVVFPRGGALTSALDLVHIDVN